MFPLLGPLGHRGIDFSFFLGSATSRPRTGALIDRNRLRNRYLSHSCPRYTVYNTQSSFLTAFSRSFPTAIAFAQDGCVSGSRGKLRKQRTLQKYSSRKKISPRNTQKNAKKNCFLNPFDGSVLILKKMRSLKKSYFRDFSCISRAFFLRFYLEEADD